MNSLTQEELDLLTRVKEKPELRGYFFNKIKSLKWFDTLKANGFLDPTEIPHPKKLEGGDYQIPVWPVLNYLVESSKRIAAEKNYKFANKYLALFREYFIVFKGDNLCNGRVWWKLSEALRYIPTELITNEDVEMFDSWLDNRFERSLIIDELSNLLIHWLDDYDVENKDKCIRLIEILFKFQVVEEREIKLSHNELVFRAQSFKYTNKIENIAYESGKKIGIDAVKLFHILLTQAITKRGGDDFSYIWRITIEDHEQNNSSSDTEDFFIVAFRESIIACEKYWPGSAKKLIESILKSDLNINKRIAIYTINQNFQEYKNTLFNKLLNEKSFSLNLKHEFWELIKNNFAEFSNIQKLNFFELVSQIKHYKNTDEPGLHEQAEWLAAIKDIDLDASNKYDQLVKLIQFEPEHPGLSTFRTSAEWIDEKDSSPLSIEELKEIGNVSNLIITLNKYVNEESIASDFDIEGLVKVFKSFVLLEEKEGNQLFLHLDKYKNLNICFLYELIDSYNQIWREENEYQQFNWTEAWPALITFISDIISSNEFWESTHDKSDAFIGNRFWLISSVCRLIENGSKKDGDKRNLPISKYKNILVFLKKIIETTSYSDFGEIRDAVSSAINSPYGHAIQAVVTLALYVSRYKDSENGSHLQVWEEFEPIFNNELDKQENLEFYTLIPLYLNNMFFLSKKWIEHNFRSFFNPSNSVQWVCALNGLSYNNRPSEIVLEFFKEKGIYEQVLDDTQNIRTEKRFVDYGVFLYLWDKESVDDKDSLIARLLNRRKPDELRQMIWFFRYGLKYDNKIKTKVLELFPKILERIDFDTLDGKRLASYLAHWFILIDDLNEQSISWIKEVIPYVEADHNSNEAIEAIEIWSNTHQKEVVEIWMEMFKINPGYPYPEDSFKAAFRNLINSNLERKVKDIVGEYMKFNSYAPQEWLKSVLEE
ncbi:hypothetical protein ACFODZ_05010 [Marinicella sediminis]|uniref:DUF4020 domain-containing protein n=1 Tax=Marinicella sediminis TaxID=1792834 RepID=A0ABV7JDU9_9GAMM|nr:hypothetical protein [Marinicella sediminis]